MDVINFEMFTSAKSKHLERQHMGPTLPDGPDPLKSKSLLQQGHKILSKNL